MAAMLRDKMDAIDSYYPDHKPIVVIGHSMGGMIARELMTDSGLTIWNSFFDTPPDKTPLSPLARLLLTKTLIFQHRRDISRVIFMSASLRGAYLATGFLGRLGETIIGAPPDLTGVGKELAMLSKPRATDGKKLKHAPNSIDALDPNNRFVTTIDKIPLAPGIPYHSIIADRGKGGHLDRTKPQSTDGLVPYWSSHLDGAQSEVIVPSDHWSNRSPQGIAEVRRILLLHIGRAGGAVAPKVAKEPATAAR
jgi:pimeloyl-ACP methyl ester carboxylesterase